MTDIQASKKQKLKWIAGGLHIRELIKDSNNAVSIKAKLRKLDLDKDEFEKSLGKIKLSMPADIFDVIQLLAKTDEQVHQLIADHKFLTFFAAHDKLGYRIRAKRELKVMVEEEKRKHRYRMYE